MRYGAKTNNSNITYYEETIDLNHYVLIHIFYNCSGFAGGRTTSASWRTADAASP